MKKHLLEDAAEFDLETAELKREYLRSRPRHPDGSVCKSLRTFGGCHHGKLGDGWGSDGWWHDEPDLTITDANVVKWVEC